MPLVTARCHSHTTLVTEEWNFWPDWHWPRGRETRKCDAEILVLILQIQRTTSDQRIEPQQSRPPINLLLLLLLLFGSNHSQGDATLVSSLLFISISTHVMSIASQLWLRWFKQADVRRGEFSPSASPMAVTQEVPWSHYPAFSPKVLGQTEVYWNITAQSSLALCFMNQWNMLQTLHPGTPFPGSTRAFGHNLVLSSCKMQKTWAESRSQWTGMYWVMKTLRRGALPLL